MCIALLLCACDTRDKVWGVYSTEKGGDGNFKRVEFAYSKVFYTLDALAAEAESDDPDGENEAVIEGWYEIEGDEIVCTFSLTEDSEVREHVYLFVKEGDTLTLTGYTVDGEEAEFVKEEYKR